MAKRIAVFNHKGGVGKTLTTFNLGWMLSELGSKVLLVDGDSQVNLTALTLGGDRFEKYYTQKKTKLKNIKDGVAAIFEGRPATIEGFQCPHANENEDLIILPGHAELSTYEGQLSLAQETVGSLSVLRNLPGAISSLMQEIEEIHEVDFTLIDLNPGLGALNQNFFMSSDFFLVPTNPDPFSLMAVRTLGEYVVRWNQWKESHAQRYSGAEYTLPSSTTKFIGNINARFNKHASKAARKFDERIKEIDLQVETVLVPKLKSAGMLCRDKCYTKAYEDWKSALGVRDPARFALARIPDFQSLVHIANQHQKPVFALTEAELRKERLGGSSLASAKSNVSDFKDIFSAIANKVEYLTSDECR